MKPAISVRTAMLNSFILVFSYIDDVQNIFSLIQILIICSTEYVSCTYYTDIYVEHGIRPDQYEVVCVLSYIRT